MLSLQEKIAIVVPCYNEVNRINMTEFISFNKNVTFLFVNDGSTDETLNHLEAYKSEQVLILNLVYNQGKAGAVREGILYLKNNYPLGCFKFIGFWDADLATPLNEINHMINYTEMYNLDCDAIYGCRVLRSGSNIVRETKRHILGRIFATIVSKLFGILVYDTQCGAKIFKSKVAFEIFEKELISKWIFDVELTLRLRRHSYQLLEYPLFHWRDVEGSKINLSREFPRVLKDLIKIKSLYHKDS